MIAAFHGFSSDAESMTMKTLGLIWYGLCNDIASFVHFTPLFGELHGFQIYS